MSRTPDKSEEQGKTQKDSSQFSNPFRESLQIIRDSISEKQGSILLHPQSLDYGAHERMVDAPFACMAENLGKKYGDYSLYEMSKTDTGSKPEVMGWMSSCTEHSAAMRSRAHS